MLDCQIFVGINIENKGKILNIADEKQDLFSENELEVISRWVLRLDIWSGKITENYQNNFFIKGYT